MGDTLGPAGYLHSSRVCISPSGSAWLRDCHTPRSQRAGNGDAPRTHRSSFLFRVYGAGCQSITLQRGRGSICLPRLQCVLRHLFYFYLGNSLAVFDALPKCKESSIAGKHTNQHILGERAHSIFRLGSSFLTQNENVSAYLSPSVDWRLFLAFYHHSPAELTSQETHFLSIRGGF